MHLTAVILITENYRQKLTTTIYRQQTKNSEAHQQNTKKYYLPTNTEIKNYGSYLCLNLQFLSSRLLLAVGQLARFAHIFNIRAAVLFLGDV